MQNLLTTMLGFAVLAYMGYVLGLTAKVMFGWGEASWDEALGHWVFVGIVGLLMLIGHVWGDREEAGTEKAAEKNPYGGGGQNPNRDSEPDFNPYLDQLEWGVYRQEALSWWFDSDGDRHERGIYHASLRFYEDGTVIGIRSSAFPKREMPDSFTLKGTFTVQKNRLALSLEKVREVDDTIFTYISPEEQREMKYYGEIADDNSLIKAGLYQGRISGHTLLIGVHPFTLAKLAKLI
ncbi:MAG: hypothetical protein D6722_11340 [Bacteroidetes bacterium]|nr:MAG: hypothetical protein D6722_11340 [Bacteroidota bacterium]